ncbi:putative membrane protein [Weissella oryzae SG25]|uniref:Putative membrane protein n=1 Tax=Weissella oryzae (strain DSM 25784 / JCM 18191 / LMG 30913 / SG25) TaxID=1329250 RepID=A0A069CUQ4_WEIOS|nr:DUF805 domain-containing protein [Weissella oryzae]GAK30958.1 putative membrane protein [Weissella oryzae SG25]
MFASYKRFWINIFNFSGVSNRADYWWPIIINYIIGGVIIAIVQASIGHSIDNIYTIGDLSIAWERNLIVLIVWIATLSVRFRRLHDTNRTGWWVLLDLIPVVGTIWFFILMVLPSKPNRWQ